MYLIIVERMVLVNDFVSKYKTTYKESRMVTVAGMVPTNYSLQKWYMLHVT